MTNTALTPEALYSISQVNALTGVPKSTIRFWEREFKDFLSPLRTVGNQRRYDRQTVEVIERINKMVNVEGFTLDGARRKLRDTGGQRETPDGDAAARLDQLAATMSDYLLQKLFERVRTEERSRGNSSGLINSNSLGGSK